MRRIQTKTIVFITGAFLSNSIWDEWRNYFEGQGYITIAPSWPHKDATTAELRSRHPDSAIASVDLKGVVAHYTGILKSLPEQTILIGHSVGGLITQLLLQEDLALAGIVIHSMPPQNLLKFNLSFFKSPWASFGFFTSGKKSFLMSFPEWQHVFANGMPLSLQKSGYEQFLVPESKKLFRDLYTNVAKVDFKKTHVPLLFISATEDQFVPASLSFSNYKHYLQNDSITDYKQFDGKNHLVLIQPSWEQEAEFILNWINGLKNQKSDH
jgi:pimeloyl-ACP methyl ester carboxylesterase